MVRIPLTFLAVAAFAAAQSHPSWWNYASPDATALVGIDWQIVRASPFADPMEAELFGDLGFPDLRCLRNARQILISSPDLLAVASGNFSLLRDQAANQGLRAMTYRGIDMWFAMEKGGLSIARISDQLAIVGDPKTLQAAVDRTLSDSKDHSPLLARAAQFGQKDMWVVASQLPDDLANRFVPLDTEAKSFAGSVSVRGGLEVEAVLTAGSEKEAAASAEKLRKALPTLPMIARGLEITPEDDAIYLNLSATREQVIAALRGPDPAPVPVETIRIETPKGVQHLEMEKPEPPKPIVAAAEKPVEKRVEKPVEKPQVIRIFGLDEGPREIVIKPEKQNP